MLKTVCVVVLAALLSACNGSGGDEFVGKWVSVKNECSRLDVVKNGEAYIVKLDLTEVFIGRVQATLPATIKDGILRAESGNAPLNLSIDKKTNNLIGGRIEYRRNSGSEKDCYPEAKK